MNTFTKWLAGPFTVLAVTLITNCGGSGPTNPDPPDPCAPNCPIDSMLVVEFPGAVNVDHVNRTVTIFAGDSLGCVIESKSASIIVGWNYDNRPVFCAGPIEHPLVMRYIGVSAPNVVIASPGNHRLDFLLQSTGGTLLKVVTYTLVVVPRPAGLQTASAVAHSAVHAGGQLREPRLSAFGRPLREPRS